MTLKILSCPYINFLSSLFYFQKSLTRDCHFIESLEHGYFLYANAYNPLWRVGFTRGLKPVGPRHWKKPQSLRRACFLFVKINAEHFDRDMFTTTTTTTTTTTSTTTTTPRSTQVPAIEHNNSRHTELLKVGEGHKRQDSKASIIDSNNNYNKTKKSGGANGHRHRGDMAESINNAGGGRKKSTLDIRWKEGREFTRQQHRKRKHHTKPASGKPLQPKNLIRHDHNNQGNGEEAGARERRRYYQKEEKIRKMRLKNQRTRKQLDDETHRAEPLPNATNSATPSVAATTLAATASLAPSALNIVAMLAAGRRKKGRRKKQVEVSESQTTERQQSMDLQLVAQSPLQAQSQYDLVLPENSSNKIHKHRHEHNYHQKSEPVSGRRQHSATKESLEQQQNHKYSNNLNNKDSHLFSSSSSTSSSSNSNNSNNLNSNFLSSNLNDNVNAIPALPKKYLSKIINNQQKNHKLTKRSLTDFNTNKVNNFSHPALNLKKLPQNQQKQQISNDNNKNSYFNKLVKISPIQQKSNISSKQNSHSHSFYKIPLTVFRHKTEKSESNDDEDDDYKNYNSNRLLDNNHSSNNIRDNNFQQEHLVNRFKLIYLDRIRSHSFNFKFNSNSKNKMNNTKNEQHYYNKSKSPISGSSTTTAATASNRSYLRSRRTTTTNSSHSHKRSRRNIIMLQNSTRNSSNSSSGSYVLENNNENVNNNDIVNISNSYNIYNQFKLKAKTSAYRNRIFLGQQQEHLINSNPNNNYNYDDKTDNNDVGNEKFKRIQNKYEKIIVQYRSVVNLLIKCFIFQG